MCWCVFVYVNVNGGSVSVWLSVSVGAFVGVCVWGNCVGAY